MAGKLFFATSRALPVCNASHYFFSIDDDLRYEGFYCDFGPLNLGMLYRCSKLSSFPIPWKTSFPWCSLLPPDSHNPFTKITQGTPPLPPKVL